MSKIDKAYSFAVLAIVSIALMLGVVGCQKTGTQDTSSQSQPVQTDQSQDPAAAANLAPVDATQPASTTDRIWELEEARKPAPRTQAARVNRCRPISLRIRQLRPTWPQWTRLSQRAPPLSQPTIRQQTRPGGRAIGSLRRTKTIPTRTIPTRTIPMTITMRAGRIQTTASR